MNVLSDPVTGAFGSNPVSSVLVVVVSIVAGIIVLLRTDRATLRQDNVDLREGRKDDAAEILRLKSDLSEAKAEYAQAHGENVVLKQLNSQQVNWTAILDMVTHHNTTVEKRWSKEDERALKIISMLQTLIDRSAP